MPSTDEFPVMRPGRVDRPPVPPLVCPIVVNGIPVVIEVYPTADREQLPPGVRDRADRTRYGRGFFVARHDPGGDELARGSPSEN